MSSSSNLVADLSKISRLERAADMAEIRDALARYAHGIDRRDFDLVLSAYHDDATEDHADFRAIKAHEFYPIVKSKLGQDLSVFHITNVMIEFAASDTALVESEAALEVSILGKHHACRILSEAPCDPRGSRMRS